MAVFGTENRSTSVARMTNSGGADGGSFSDRHQNHFMKNVKVFSEEQYFGQKTLNREKIFDKLFTDLTMQYTIYVCAICAFFAADLYDRRLRLLSVTGIVS